MCLLVSICTGKVDPKILGALGELRKLYSHNHLIIIIFAFFIQKSLIIFIHNEDSLKNYC